MASKDRLVVSVGVPVLAHRATVPKLEDHACRPTPWSNCAHRRRTFSPALSPRPPIWSPRVSSARLVGVLVPIFPVRDLDTMPARRRSEVADVAEETAGMDGTGLLSGVTRPEGGRIESWVPALRHSR